MHYLNCMLPSKNLQLKYCHRSVSPLVKNRMRRGLSSTQRFKWGSKLTCTCPKNHQLFLPRSKLTPELVTIFPQRLTSSPTCFGSFVYSSLLLSGVEPPLLKIFFLCPSTVLISITPHRIYLYSTTCLIFGWIELSSNLPLFSSKLSSCGI